MRTTFNTILKEWEADNIIEEVQDVNAEMMQQMYLLPHRHVVKENSSTTPDRPVFDASAKGKGSPSLNECLSAGPNLLELIPAIMCRFRKQRVGVVSDIKKAFLQIEVAKPDQEYLCFLWWKDDSCREIKLYRHRRVVFGVKPSPFLLAATLGYHVKRECVGDEAFASQLLNSLYVDNSCSSHENFEDAMKFEETAQNILLPAKFDLRGWEWSKSKEEKEVAVLGMMWDTKTDNLRFSLDSVCKKMSSPGTKRGLLSIVNSLFDPMGFLCAFTIVPKLLLQDCCRMKLGWDDELPDVIAVKLKRWKAQVPVIEKIKIRRWIGYSPDNCDLSIHCFCDASGHAFATMIFVRVAVGNVIEVYLVMAKARVAPLKQKVSIPRMEMLGCGIGARLTANHVVLFLELEGVPTLYYTDSTTCLAWIQRDKEWARFVANRVRKITRKEDWYHVPGELNPADIPSRGCTAEFLFEKQLWKGPEWLKRPQESWPSFQSVTNEEEVGEELKKSVVVCSVQVEDPFLQFLQRYSDYHHILRIMAMVVRYLKNLQRRACERKLGNQCPLQKEIVTPATAEEICEAEVMLLLMIQKEAFQGIHDKRIVGMGAFLDDKNLSQLLFGNEDFGVRCPIVLPHDHPIVKALIFKEHSLNSHAGVQIIQAKLRERYWILRSRRTVGAIVTSCPICRRYVARRCGVPSAPLLLDRVRDTVAFDVTGVDLAGPLYLRGGGKAWIVLYTCAVFRAVHLELVTTLSTQGFLDSFRRFVARRGRPSKVYSDNGLNFVGCSNLFKEIDWTTVQSYAAVGRISWIFNPPSAPWWGGFWERLVGIMKQLIRRMLGKKTVGLEEMQTLLCDVEASMNQRPLTFVSDRKDELIPLCPAHFIKDNPQCNLPEADAVDAKALRNTIRQCQTLREEFRVRFRKDYLGQLQHQAGIKEITVKVGDVVVVEDDNRKRLDWSLGVIVEVYPVRDGRVCTARVRTKDGLFLRAVQRLFIMEVAEAKEEKDPTELPEVEATGGNDRVSRFGRKIVKPNRFKF